MSETAIRFLGAAREVTGSMHLVETAQGTILVDCGLFQGHRQEARERNRTLPREAIAADAVVLTHAHIDHSGSLPTLVKAGFRGAIWTTPATRDLSALMLRDSARIQESDARWLHRKLADTPGFVPIEPLYDENDAIAALTCFIGVPYHTTFAPLPGVTARFLDAGHILGSAQLVLDIAGTSGRARRLVFSGDLGRHDLPLLRDPETPTDADDLVMESTYGDRAHPRLDAVHEELAHIVSTTAARGGKIVVPAFALGRSQELIYVLHQLYQTGRVPELPIFVDSPLATHVTEVFKLHAECFDAETRRFVEECGDPFSFRALRYVESTEESMRLNELAGPAIIIAGSGMCESGRVLHHLRNTVGDERNSILIVGFMAQHTLGRRLVERRARVRILGVERDLFAQVHTLNAFSAHADKNDLHRYALAATPRRNVFLVHGEPDQQEPLRARLSEESFQVAVPSRGERIVLA
jgi:metallo-beta-lactamase family protein